MPNPLYQVSIGGVVKSEDINQILRKIMGIDGVPIQFTAINDAANYAVTVRNLDPTNSRSFAAKDYQDLPILTAEKFARAVPVAGGSLGGIITSTSPRQRLQVTLAGTVTLATGGVWQTLSWDGNDVVDTDAVHDPSGAVSPADKLIVKRIGNYQVRGIVQWNDVGGGWRELRVLRNGGVLATVSAIGLGTIGLGGVPVTFAYPLPSMQADDFIQIQALSTVSGTTILSPGTYAELIQDILP